MFPWPAYIEDIDKCLNAIANNEYDSINDQINEIDFKMHKFMSLEEYYKLFDSNTKLSEYLNALSNKNSFVCLPEKHARSQAAKVRKRRLLITFK